MNNLESQVKYSFRIIGITEKQLRELKNLFNSARIKVGNNFDQKRIRVACIELDKNFEYDKLVAFVKTKGLKNYGVWISFEVLRDSDGFTVPSFITDLLFDIGGRLDISTLCLI